MMFAVGENRLYDVGAKRILMASAPSRYRLGDVVSIYSTTTNPESLDQEVEHYSIPDWFIGQPSSCHSSEIHSNKLHLPEHGIILVSKLNPSVHKTWNVPPAKDTNKVRLASTEWVALIPKNLEDFNFVWCVVNSTNFQHQMNGYATGTTNSHQRVRPFDMLRFEIPFLESEARTRIGDLYLSTENICSKISLMNRSLISLCELEFDSFFGDLNARYIKSEQENAPTTSIWESAKFVNGIASGKIETSQDPDKGIPLVKIAELSRGISKSTSFTNSSVDSRYILHDGDVLLSWSGNPDTSIDQFIWTSGKAVLNQHIFRVESENQTKKTYMFFLVRKLLPMLVWCAKNRMTTGLGHFTKTDLKNLRYNSPAENNLREFGIKCNPLFNQIISNQIKINTIKSVSDDLIEGIISRR